MLNGFFHLLNKTLINGKPTKDTRKVGQLCQSENVGTMNMLLLLSIWAMKTIEIKGVYLLNRFGKFVKENTRNEKISIKKSGKFVSPKMWEPLIYVLTANMWPNSKLGTIAEVNKTFEFFRNSS